MRRKRQFLIFLLAVCLPLTACTEQKLPEAEPAPIVTEDGIVSQITGESDAIIFQGGEIVPEPTYRNGTKYEPFGRVTEYTVPIDDGTITCTFKLPDEEIFTLREAENYRFIGFNCGLDVTFGYFQNLQNETLNRDKMLEAAIDAISVFRSDLEYEIQEEYIYETENHQFQAIAGISRYQVIKDTAHRWVYIMGTQVNNEIFAYWAVEEPGGEYGEYLHECENIMLSFEVAA